MDGTPDRDLDDAIRHAEQVLADLRREHADRAMRHFLAVLARAVPEGIVFSAAELLHHAEIDPDLRAVLDGVTPKRLGKYLQRLAAHGPTENGLALRRVARDGRGCIWALALTR